MLGEGSNEQQHEAAHDVRGTWHGGWYESGTLGHWRVSVMREWELMAPITDTMPLGGACVILSPNWNEGNHALSALQGGVRLFETLPGH